MCAFYDGGANIFDKLCFGGTFETLLLHSTRHVKYIWAKLSPLKCHNGESNTMKWNAANVINYIRNIWYWWIAPALDTRKGSISARTNPILFFIQPHPTAPTNCIWLFFICMNFLKTKKLPSFLPHFLRWRLWFVSICYCWPSCLKWNWVQNIMAWVTIS